MAASLDRTTTERDAGIDRVWSAIDADGDGTLSTDEVRWLLQRMNMADGDDAVEKAMLELDMDQSGDVDRHEFAVWFEKQDEAAREALQLSALADGVEAAQLLASMMHHHGGGLELSRQASSPAARSRLLPQGMGLQHVTVECDMAIGARLPDGHPDAVAVFLAKDRARELIACDPGNHARSELSGRLQALENYIKKNAIQRPLEWDINQAAGIGRRPAASRAESGRKLHKRLLLLGAAGAGKRRLLAQSFAEWEFAPVWDCWETGSSDVLGTAALPVSAQDKTRQAMAPPLAWASGSLLRRAHAVVLLLDPGSGSGGRWRPSGNRRGQSDQQVTWQDELRTTLQMLLVSVRKLIFCDAI